MRAKCQHITPRSTGIARTFGGMIKLIMEVPALQQKMRFMFPSASTILSTHPLAASRLLMSFLTFHI